MKLIQEKMEPGSIDFQFHDLREDLIKHYGSTKPLPLEEKMKWLMGYQESWYATFINDIKLSPHQHHVVDRSPFTSLVYKTVHKLTQAPPSVRRQLLLDFQTSATDVFNRLLQDWSHLMTIFVFIPENFESHQMAVNTRNCWLDARHPEYSGWQYELFNELIMMYPQLFVRVPVPFAIPKPLSKTFFPQQHLTLMDVAPKSMSHDASLLANISVTNPKMPRPSHQENRNIIIVETFPSITTTMPNMTTANYPGNEKQYVEARFSTLGQDFRTHDGHLDTHAILYDYPNLWLKRIIEVYDSRSNNTTPLIVISDLFFITCWALFVRHEAKPYAWLKCLLETTDKALKDLNPKITEPIEWISYRETPTSRGDKGSNFTVVTTSWGSLTTESHTWHNMVSAYDLFRTQWVPQNICWSIFSGK
jgi:hypothetical protein